jgi:hypothetical protein
MFLRPNHRAKDGKDHTYWSLVETVRTPDGGSDLKCWGVLRISIAALCHISARNNCRASPSLRANKVFILNSVASNILSLIATLV